MLDCQCTVVSRCNSFVFTEPFCFELDEDAFAAGPRVNIRLVNVDSIYGGCEELEARNHLVTKRRRPHAPP